jgi:hypothetical protein
VRFALYGSVVWRDELGTRFHAWTLSRIWGKCPFAKEIGLIFAACRVIRDVQLHLQNIG